MLVVVEDVLTADDLGFVRMALSAVEFGDGRATAGRLAAGVKNNRQAGLDDPRLKPARDLITKRLQASAGFVAAAIPARMTPLVFARYEPGQEYGWHVDNPSMYGVRTDVSFTIFLEPPEAYDGGELAIGEEPYGARVKLKAGSLVCYPSTTLHRVAPVTRGERLVSIGWLESHVRDAARREVLHDLQRASAEIIAAHGASPAVARLSKASANLTRMWWDD